MISAFREKEVIFISKLIETKAIQRTVPNRVMVCNINSELPLINFAF